VRAVEKPAANDHPIHDLLRRRWSPVAFDPRPVEREKLLSLLEAARWAASSYNEQPWRFIVATIDRPQEHARMLACLVEGNQAWARGAPVLILTVVKRAFDRGGKPNRVAEHDVGLAAGNLTTQATALGLAVHPMAGVELEKARAAYAIPPGFDPYTAIAVGYPGDASRLPEALRARDAAPRSRLPLRQIVFEGRWGAAWPLVG
jgi:nitroreductase